MSASQLSIAADAGRGAHISDCGRYRYSLWRCWEPNAKAVTVMSPAPRRLYFPWRNTRVWRADNAQIAHIHVLRNRGLRVARIGRWLIVYTPRVHWSHHL